MTAFAGAADGPGGPVLDDGLGGGEGISLGSTAAIFRYGLIGGAAGVLAQVATKGLAWVLTDKFGVGDSAGACKDPNHYKRYLHMCISKYFIGIGHVKIIPIVCSDIYDFDLSKPKPIAIVDKPAFSQGMRPAAANSSAVAGIVVAVDVALPARRTWPTCWLAREKQLAMTDFKAFSSVNVPSLPC